MMGIIKKLKKHRFFIQCLSVLVSALIVYSVFPANIINVNANQIAVWDGTKATNFAGGDGTENSPFLIENANQLYKMVEEYHTYDASKGKYFLITKDIYINDVSNGTPVEELSNKRNWLEKYGDTIATASKANSFNGFLDGGNNTIYGLYVENIHSAGLFPAISSYAEIKNLAFENLFITGGNGYGGAIAGQAIYYAWQSSAKITNCSVVDATIGQSENIQFVGGFIGDIKECSLVFTNCYSYDISLSDKATPGGIVGNAYSSGSLKMNNCYSIGYFPTRSNNSKAVCSNVYTNTSAPSGNTTANVTVLESEQMQGENAKQYMTGFAFGRDWQTVEGGFPIRFIYVKPDYVWDGTKAESFAGGDGTKDNPWLIETPSQLYKVVVDHCTKDTSYGKYFKITKDIYINDVADGTLVKDFENKENWLGGLGTTITTPTTSNRAFFYGNLDGDGHTIYGLYASGASSSGLFPAISNGASFKNLSLENVYLTGGNGSAGAIAGYANWGGIVPSAGKINIIKCSVDNITIDTGVLNAGGFIGNMSNSAMVVGNCYLKNASLTGSAFTGGMVAKISATEANLTIANSYFADCYPVTAAIDKSAFTSVYTNTSAPQGSSSYSDITVLTSEQMKGENAAQNMTGLGIGRDWKVVENDYPELAAYEKPSYVWDGTKAKEFAGGSGTKNDPWLIENGAQLYKMVSEYSNASTAEGAVNQTSYFKLTKDIYLNDVLSTDLINPTAGSWTANFNSWYECQNKKYGFCGDFNGNGHTVYGLYSKDGYSGLIPILTDGGKVYNLNVKNSFITGWGSAGGVVGYVYAYWKLKSVSVTGCTVDNCVIDSTSKQVGGIIGGFNDLKLSISDCSVTRTKVVSTNSENPNLASGLIGYGWGGKLVQKATNCFTDGFTHPVTMSNDKTSFDTVAAKVEYTDVYTSAAKNYDENGIIYLTDDQMKGENAKQYMPALDFERSWKTVEGDYPVHIIYVRPSDVWDGKKADKFEGGSGKENDPYLIKTGAQLYKMVAEYSNAVAKSGAKNTTTYFKLIDDIHLNKVYEKDLKNPVAGAWETTFIPWYSLSGVGTGFCGDFNGNGHTIYGLFANGSYAGLIPVLTDGGKVYNINLKNSFVYGSASDGSAGGIVGYVGEYYKLNAVSVSGCTVDGSVIKSVSQKAGGIVGGYGEIKFAVSDCSVIRTKVISTNSENPNLASGLVGTGWGKVTKTVTNCFTDGYAHPITASSNQADFDALAGKIKYTNVYTSSAKNFDTNGLIYLTDEQMKGENAKQYMPALDYDRSWKTVEGDYPVHIIYTRPGHVWNGKKADKFAGGKGTAYDPYLIADGAQLYKMVEEYSNASTKKDSDNAITYFKLTNDIHLNDVNEKDLNNPTAESWGTKFTPWYSLSGTGKGFCGELDGDGYTVYGLFATGSFTGLIPLLTDGGSVHNLNLRNSFVNGSATSGSVGGIVGYVGGHYTLSSVEISYCTVDNLVVKGACKMVGGIVGGFEQLKINMTDCSVTRTGITSTNAENPNLTAGFVGSGWGITGHKITNCFTDSSVQPIASTTDAESFKTIAEKFIFTNVYTSAAKNFDVEGITYLSADSELKGLSVSKVLKGFDFEKDWSAVENDYPVIRKNAGSERYDTTLPGQVWSGKLARYYASGDGSKEKPYVIETGGQLALLANDALNGKTSNKYYKLTADIVLNNTTSENWQETAKEWYTGSWGKAFRGHLDGGYHIISGLYLNKTKDNYTGTDYYGGLFACIGKNAVIEKLGIVNSSLTFTDAVSQRYVGAFAGFVDQYDSSTNKASYDEYPIIRECFADTTVTLDANSCGGFIGCATRPIRVEDSFFTGKVKSTSRGLFGYSKMGYTVDEVLVKNFYTADSKYAVLSNASYDNINCENCYSSSAQDKVGLTRLFIDRMCGEAAKEYMTGFDFKKVWTVRGENETPGLKGFNAKLYNNVMAPEDIVISFETNCDLLVDSITGKAYSKLTLPVLEREGYIFEGWYSYPELDIPFKFDYFPTFNTILYAKWTLSGYTQDFEQYEDTVYDYHEGYEYYRPTTPDYSAKYVHSGAKSMHRLPDIDEDLDFLLFYDEELEVGKTYKMVYYVTTDQDEASTDISLVHLDWPDVYTANKGVTTVGKIENLTKGRWQECTHTFVAQSKWVAIKTYGKDSVYFDDFTLYNTTDSADDVSANTKGSINNLLIIIIAIISAVVVVGFVLTFILIKKHSKQK